MDRIMSYRKSVFFARLKQRSPCLSGFCERGKRASQMLASRMPFAENASRAKTVLMLSPLRKQGQCLKKTLCSLWQKTIFSVAYEFDQKYQIMQNKPNFQNTKNVLTLVDTRSYNKLWVADYYAKQTQSNPISVIAGSCLLGIRKSGNLILW